MAKKTVATPKIDWKKMMKDLGDYGVDLPKTEMDFGMEYLKANYQASYDEYASGDVELDGTLITSHEYAMSSVANGLNDGAHMDNVETTDLGNGLVLQKEKEQEIIAVDQDVLKKSLRVLLTKEKPFLSMMYVKWEEYNDEFFMGALSHPLITIEKMNNRTLGNYSHGADAMGINNHMRYNRNFVSLNTEERVLETLRHEMIHQWQDEVLYYQGGIKMAKDIKHLFINDEGERIVVETRQKKRPKDWHNKDFKDYAKVVGIPAKGDKCYGNPAIMPEPESYNRKFLCGCVASNGYPLSVWSTRAVNATCKVCKKDFVEVPKGGKVIRVEQSHVEKPGEDAVELAHKVKYGHFERFESKELKDEFTEHYNGTDEHPMTEMVEGVYQKGHNKYKEGFTHWVAYNTAEVSPVAPPKKEVKKTVSKPKVKKPVEPKKVEPKVEKPKQAPKNKTKVKPATKPVVVPVAEPVELPKEPQMAKIIKMPKPAGAVRSYKDAEDLIEVYTEQGSIKGVAEVFGVSPGTIIYQAKQLGVDFKNGVILDGE